MIYPTFLWSHCKDVERLANQFIINPYWFPDYFFFFCEQSRWKMLFGKDWEEEVLVSLFPCYILWSNMPFDTCFLETSLSGTWNWTIYMMRKHVGMKKASLTLGLSSFSAHCCLKQFQVCPRLYRLNIERALIFLALTLPLYTLFFSI